MPEGINVGVSPTTLEPSRRILPAIKPRIRKPVGIQNNNAGFSFAAFSGSLNLIASGGKSLAGNAICPCIFLYKQAS